MIDKLYFEDLNMVNKRVLVRVDFNVPLSDGLITDDTRIQRALPTLRKVLSAGGKLVVMSHLGRPKGRPADQFSLSPVAKRLAELLEYPVKLLSPLESPSKQEKGEVVLLENLRFHIGEEHPDKDPTFAKSLSKWGEIYINDAFGTAHRKHSSTYSICSFFPDKAAAGALLKEEIDGLGRSILSPERPFHAIVGGSKISSKFGALRSLCEKADAVYIGGAMAYTFLKAQGYAIGSSLYEEEHRHQAELLLSLCKERKIPLYLPLDSIITTSLKKGEQAKSVTTEAGIPEGLIGVDIGAKTRALYTAKLSEAKTILWNGPMGVFEIEPFGEGTKAVAKALSTSAATTIVGGGDSIAALHAENLHHTISHISTGGGSTLEFIENGELPAINALSPAQSPAPQQ